MSISYKKIALLSTIFLFAFCNSTQAQDKFDTLKIELNNLALEYPGLEQLVELNVAEVNLSDFLNTISLSNRLNISCDETLNFSISNNFTNVTVTDVLIFLSRKYDLDIKLIGSIITITKHKNLPPPPPIVKPRVLQIEYDADSNLLSMDLKKDTLSSVAKQITIASGESVIVPQELENTVVSVFVKDQPFNTALDMLAYSNNLKVNVDPSGIYIFERRDQEKAGNSPRGLSSRKNNKVNGLDLDINAQNLISVSTVNVPIQDIITTISERLKINYFIFSEIKGNATLNMENATYEQLLSYLLNGTEFTYKNENNIYLFGERSVEGLRATKVLALKFRTVDKIADFIPAELKKGVEIKTFPDQNSLILSGSQPRITELENFITKIDRVVPVISLEVIILEVQKTSEVTKGLTAGLSTAPVQTQGTIFPGIDLTLSSQSINNVIDKVGGLAGLDLGHVTPNFYMTLQLLETNGAVKIKSTPKLATLNGHEATLSIGETQYYLETQNAVVGTQNPQNITTQQYKSVNADLTLTFNPTVSADEEITLDIKVKQSTFTARISPTAPPGNTTRNFQSLIRVKNEETVILGGLEENSINDSGKGIPGLARIPVLNWIFGNKDLAKSTSKLVILIKPTVQF